MMSSYNLNHVISTRKTNGMTPCQFVFAGIYISPQLLSGNLNIPVCKRFIFILCNVQEFVDKVIFNVI